MTETQAQIILDFIDENWARFENGCLERNENPENIRSEIEKIAMGN